MKKRSATPLPRVSMKLLSQCHRQSCSHRATSNCTDRHALSEHFSTYHSGIACLSLRVAHPHLLLASPTKNCITDCAYHVAQPEVLRYTFAAMDWCASPSACLMQVACTWAHPRSGILCVKMTGEQHHMVRMLQHGRTGQQSPGEEG